MPTERFSLDGAVETDRDDSTVAPEDPNAARERDRVKHNRDPETEAPYGQVEIQELSEPLRNEEIGDIAAERLGETISESLDVADRRALGARIHAEADLDKLPSLGSLMGDLIENQGYSVGVEVTTQAARQQRELIVDQFSTDELHAWAKEIVQNDGQNTE